MHRTLIIRREYLHFIPKYARYEKRHKNLAAHVSPAFRVEDGDQVTVGQCRPLSKTVCFISIYFKKIPCFITSRESWTSSVAFKLTKTDVGSLQRSPCPSPDGKAGQTVQQVLDRVQLVRFLSWHGFVVAAGLLRVVLKQTIKNRKGGKVRQLFSQMKPLFEHLMIVIRLQWPSPFKGMRVVQVNSALQCGYVSN